MEPNAATVREVAEAKGAPAKPFTTPSSAAN
jgi:hypothetical protein